MLLNTKLITRVALVQSSPRCAGPRFLRFCISPQGALCQISAWRHTQQDKREFGKKWCVYRQQRVKEMDRERETDGGGGGVELGRERKRVKERSEGERVLMMLKIGQWALSTLSVNHCYSFLSSYLSSCPPITELPLSFLSLSSPSLILWGGIQNFHLLTIFGLSP